MQITEERLRILRENNLESRMEARECIKRALIDLMHKKPYDDISMTAIINKSGVSRSGVYRNYKSKDAIMLDIYKEPIDEVISGLGESIFDNMELIFRIGKKHEKAFRIMIDAGLEHNILDIMNERYGDASISFYIPLWNGMIYNAFFEWIKSGTSEPVDAVVARVIEGLRLVADSINTGLTNDTHNK